MVWNPGVPFKIRRAGDYHCGVLCKKKQNKEPEPPVNQSPQTTVLKQQQLPVKPVLRLCANYQLCRVESALSENRVPLKPHSIHRLIIIIPINIAMLWGQFFIFGQSQSYR